MKSIAVFCTGKGSNAEAIIRFSKQSKSYKVDLVCSNKAESPALVMAKKLDVDTRVLNACDLEGELLFKHLNKRKITLVVLAGFLKKIPASFLDGFNGKVINIHPSLLPAHGGSGMYGLRVHAAAIASGDSESGCTIHYVDEHYDNGKIIAQFKCEITSKDSPEDLARRVLILEHEHLPVVIKNLLDT